MWFPNNFRFEKYWASNRTESIIHSSRLRVIANTTCTETVQCSCPGHHDKRQCAIDIPLYKMTFIFCCNTSINVHGLEATGIWSAYGVSCLRNNRTPFLYHIFYIDSLSAAEGACFLMSQILSHCRLCSVWRVVCRVASFVVSCGCLCWVISD